jgi:5-methylcytosine-specific restriction endonuclease McrA
MTNTIFAYHAYLRSAQWHNKRQRVLQRDNHRCALCGSTHQLEVHHNTYERLGHEKRSDLITLCADCHAIFHDRLCVHSVSLDEKMSKTHIA